ncbi:MAG: hypothetical protein XXXJIFNMEKO3_02772 [Candidatus Erwinia impunctatus]|nr:hypothetical protein XXXJIFNMEKO_02772 [Culicoides impunctatus]
MKKGLLVLLMMVSLYARAMPANITPEKVSYTFYTWYLNALNQNESPIDEHDPQLKDFITPQLLQKIHLLIKSPEGMDDDYFLQDQDYSDSWVGHISTGRFTLSDEVALGDVVLGDDPRDQQRLLVTLRRHQGVWKLSDVRREDE